MKSRKARKSVRHDEKQECEEEEVSNTESNMENDAMRCLMMSSKECQETKTGITK